MRKFYVSMLVIIMALSTILAACSGGSNNSGSENGTKSNGDSQSVDSTAGSVDNAGSRSYTIAPPGEYPFVDEPVEIVITTHRHPNVLSYEYGENDFTTYVSDLTGIKIKWNLYPSADYMEKFNLELSSGGDLGDVMMNFMDVDRAFLTMYGSQGVFLPLNDLIDEHGYWIKKAMEDYPNYRQGITAADGNIYALHEMGMCYNCERAKRFWVHSGFLENLGMDVPQTTDELYEFLKAVKENDVNGNGNPNDEIGIVGDPTGWMSEVHDFIMNAFTIRGNDNLYVDDSGTIVAAFLKEEFREGLKYLNMLYSEGLIDPSSWTNDSSTRSQMAELYEGNAIAAAPAGGSFAAENSTRLKYEIVPPLEGPTGLRYAWKNEYPEIGPPRFKISADTEHPELAFKLIDFFYSPENHKYGRYGIEGEHWEVPEEGVVAANGEQAKFRIVGTDIWNERHTVHWHGTSRGRSFFGSDSRERMPEGQFDLETVLYEAAVLYDPYTIDGTMVPPFFFDVDDAKRYNELRTEINRYLDAAIADFIVGSRDLDHDWERYKSELETIGVQEYLEIQQNEYDRNWR